jgi:hypothetical protein
VSFCRYVYRECAAGPLLSTRHPTLLAGTCPKFHLFLIALIRSPTTPYHRSHHHSMRPLYLVEMCYKTPVTVYLHIYRMRFCGRNDTPHFMLSHGCSLPSRMSRIYATIHLQTGAHLEHTANTTGGRASARDRPASSGA